MFAVHDAVHIYYRWRRVLPGKRSRVCGAGCRATGTRLQSAVTQARSILECRSRDDEPLSAREVYVTDDGAETDLDLGHYERFTAVAARQTDNITSGRIYQRIIARERRGDYLGATVQVIPHVTDAIKEFVCDDVDDLDFMLCEIGGTVGDIEGLPFFEAIRQLGNELGRDRSLFVHLTLLPFIPSAGELKTKPTQHSVKELRSIGIQPDILLCRCDREIPANERRKIALFCNVRDEAVIPALDVESIYEVPLRYHLAGLDSQVLKAFGLTSVPEPDLSTWEEITSRLSAPDGEVKIAVVGKYTGLKDAYKSLDEALVHGGIANKVQVDIEWIESEMFEQEGNLHYLEGVNGILVPGGFGERGIEGKIAAAKIARERRIPYFGICLGMQMAVIETARNLANLPGAGSTEFGHCEDSVVGLMTEWEREGQLEHRDEESDVGGTMRLGAYDCVISPTSKVFDIYKAEQISERHRHRYEVNLAYENLLARSGVIFPGKISRRTSSRDIGSPGPPMVHWGSIPSGIEIQAI